MIDVDGQISAVHRRLGTRVLEAGEARVMTISQSYDAEIEDVWDACTDPERIPRWFLPVTGDFRVGGKYALEGNATGTIERCEPPKLLAATWEFGGEVSWIEVVLSSDSADRTTFRLEHVAHVDDTRWAEFGPGATGVGWDLSLMALGLHLGSGESVDPQAAAEWSTSPEGKQFIQESSDRWCETSVAAGTDPEAARSAADKTTAAYTA